MSNHTPGPWVAKQEFANRWRIESHANGPEFIPVSVGIACTTILEVGCTDEDTEANARMMAAAPDLLAALVWMRDRDDKNGSLPEAYRRKIDETLSILEPRP